MTASTSATTRPDVGLAIPTVAVRVLFALVAAGLCISQLVPALLVLAFVIVTFAAVFPRTFAPWVLIALLGLSIIWREPAIGDWRFFVMLAGLHLLHLLGSQLLVLPVPGSVQLRSIGLMLRRFVLIQVPCQAVAALALLFFAPRGLITAAVPVLGVLAVVALLGLSLLLAWRIRSSREGD